MARRRVCLVRGRFRVPFKGYQRPQPSSPPGQDEHFGVFDALPTPLRFLALRRLAEAEVRRPLGKDRMKYLGRLAGIASAVGGGRVGNQRWAHYMLAKRGGQALARHAPHILKRGRERLAARRAFDRAVRVERALPPNASPPSSRA